MLTRQNFSYVLWLLPVLSFLFWPRADSPYSRRRALGRLLGTMGTAGAAALAVWIPMLLAAPRSEIWKRIFYQARFLESADAQGRLGVALANARELFLPFLRSADGAWELRWDQGWYWAYLTPVICVLTLLAYLTLVVQRQWRVIGFLTSWFVLTCAPVVILGQILFTRYAVLSVVPLLLTLAWAASSIAEAKSSRAQIQRVVQIVFALALVWPAAESLRQITDWEHQRLVVRDRWQYITGWPAGSAVRQAINFIESVPRGTPTAVINVVGDAFPNLALAVFFDRHPTVRVYHMEWEGLEPSLGETWLKSHTLTLRRDYRLSMPASPVAFGNETVVFCVSPDPYFWLGRSYRTEEFAGRHKAMFREVARYTNPAFPGIPGEASAVVVYRLQTAS